MSSMGEEGGEAEEWAESVKLSLISLISFKILNIYTILVFSQAGAFLITSQ